MSSLPAILTRSISPFRTARWGVALCQYFILRGLQRAVSKVLGVFNSVIPVIRRTALLLILSSAIRTGNTPSTRRTGQVKYTKNARSMKHAEGAKHFFRHLTSTFSTSNFPTRGGVVLDTAVPSPKRHTESQIS